MPGLGGAGNGSRWWRRCALWILIPPVPQYSTDSWSGPDFDGIRPEHRLEFPGHGLVERDAVAGLDHARAAFVVDQEVDRVRTRAFVARFAQPVQDGVGQVGAEVKCDARRGTGNRERGTGLQIGFLVIVPGSRFPVPDL